MGTFLEGEGKFSHYLLKKQYKTEMQEIIQFGFLEHKYMQTRNKTRNAVIFTLTKEGIHKNKKVRNAKNRNLEKNYEFCNFCVFKLPFLWYDDNRRCD